MLTWALIKSIPFFKGVFPTSQCWRPLIVCLWRALLRHRNMDEYALEYGYLKRASCFGSKMYSWSYTQNKKTWIFCLSVSIDAIFEASIVGWLFWQNGTQLMLNSRYLLSSKMKRNYLSYWRFWRCILVHKYSSFGKTLNITTHHYLFTYISHLKNNGRQEVLRWDNTRTCILLCSENRTYQPNIKRFIAAFGSYSGVFRGQSEIRFMQAPNFN